MTPWKLPLVVLALAVPTIAGFFFGGPGVGVTVGAVAAVALVVIAARMQPRGELGHDPAAVSGRRLLVVACCPLEEPEIVSELAASAAGAETMVLAPVRIGFLDRWASDLEGARREAQRNLVLTVASLAKAGIEAEARVGDEDVVQAVSDQLGSFDATEVVLVAAAADAEPVAAAERELRERLRPSFRSRFVNGPSAR